MHRSRSTRATVLCDARDYRRARIANARDLRCAAITDARDWRRAVLADARDWRRAAIAGAPRAPLRSRPRWRPRAVHPPQELRLVDDLDPQLLRPPQLRRARIAPRHHAA